MPFPSPADRRADTWEGRVEVVIGIGLVLLGAVGATATSKVLEAMSRSRLLPLALIPNGVLVGAGAALVRGWHLVGSIVAGAILVPLVGVGMRLWEVRRRDRDSAG